VRRDSFCTSSSEPNGVSCVTPFASCACGPDFAKSFALVADRERSCCFREEGGRSAVGCRERPTAACLSENGSNNSQSLTVCYIGLVVVSFCDLLDKTPTSSALLRLGTIPRQFISQSVLESLESPTYFLLAIRLPMGEYMLVLLFLRHAFPNEKASNFSLCSFATGRRYFEGGIFSPGL
jgi:hypothetical protein